MHTHHLCGTFLQITTRTDIDFPVTSKRSGSSKRRTPLNCLIYCKGLTDNGKNCIVCGFRWWPPLLLLHTLPTTVSAAIADLIRACLSLIFASALFLARGR